MESEPYQLAEGDEVLVEGMLIRKSDGTYVRPSNPFVQTAPASLEFVDGVASKDIVVDPETGLWARIFLPESVANSQTARKVPVVVFYCGGGFIVGAPDGEVNLKQCVMTARVSEVVVVSMSYRLAPEFKLPSAYKDGHTSLLWLRKQASLQVRGEGEPWLTKYADYSQCFLCGESAGGNLVHHLTAQISEEDLSPLCIRGIILLVPFFGQEERSESEILNGNSPANLATVGTSDTIWLLDLPVGATKNHPYCNVLGPDAPDLTKMRIPKVLILLAGKDYMYSTQKKYIDALKKGGNDVKVFEVPEGGHGFRIFPPFQADVRKVEQAISDFIHK